MAQDLLLEQSNYGLFDLEIDTETKDFITVDGFETALNFQLFVDRRSTRDDIATPRARQGWIADILTKTSGSISP